MLAILFDTTVLRLSSVLPIDTLNCILDRFENVHILHLLSNKGLSFRTGMSISIIHLYGVIVLIILLV